MRIDGPQITGSFNLNGDTIADLDIFATTSSLNNLTSSVATTGSNLFKGNQTISGSIIPAVDNAYDLGSSTFQFRDLYLSSASLYIDGTKVLGSTAQELQITTDTGQSFKILEDGSDNITLQSTDGNIELKSSGGGDVILDPTTGIIALKGTTTLYAGNRILSSDGNAIQIGNSLTVTGSMIVTGFIETQELRTTYISSSILFRSGSTKFGDELSDTHAFTGSLLVSGTISVPGSNLVSGSSQVLNGSGVFSGSAQLPSGIVSGSVQVDVMSTTNIARLATTGSNTFTGDIIIQGNDSSNIRLWKLYSGDPAHVGLTIQNRSGNITFSHNSNGGSTSINGGLNVTGTTVFSGAIMGTSATIAYNGLSGDFGTGYTTSLGVGYSSSVAKGINMGWNTTLDMGFIGSVHNGTGWKSLILSPIGGAVYIGATGNNDLYAGTATFSSTVDVGGNLNLISTYPRINLTDTNNNSDYSIINADGIFSIYDNTVGTNRLTISALGASTFLNTLNSVGLLTGQASIYQSDAGGQIASNRWSVYNGGATTMRFLYNASGDVIWDNGSPRMTLNASGRLLVGSINDNGARIQTSGDIRADYTSSIYLEINGGSTGEYRKGFSGINQLTSVARGLHIFNYDPDSSQGIKFYGGTFASKVRFGGFDNGGNFFINSNDSAEGHKLYVNGSTGIAGNLTINNTLSSPGNLIETAGLNIYLRPAAGNTVFVDTGNGLSVSNLLDVVGNVRYRGSIFDQFNFVASGNYTNGTYYNIIGVNQIASGIYVLEGLIDTYSAGGGIYFMRFVSVPFYMYDVGSNSNTFVDLPPVLGTGHHLGNPFPSFRLQQTLGGAGIFLQFNPNSTWAGMDNVSGGKIFQVNLKRLGA